MSSPTDGHIDEALSKSRYTYRDLRLLNQFSVNSPLRVISLIDFDCFYAQCESVRLGLSEDQALGVQQFKHVIAINYPARAAGLRKVVTAIEAKEKCPSIVLQHVPTWREGDDTWRYRQDAIEYMDSDKSSLDYYRLQSRRAIAVVKNILPLANQKVEKASIDEIFVDLSAQVHEILLERYPEFLKVDRESDHLLLPKPPSGEVLDWRDTHLAGVDDIALENGQDEDINLDWNDIALNIGTEIVHNVRKEIHQRLRYTCSAGVARNKVLAKLAAGHNKPNKQTVVRDRDISVFLAGYKLSKLRGLGGKFGQEVKNAFSAETIADLISVPQTTMQSKLGSSGGSWLYKVIRGIEHSEVTPRTQIQSMLSAKTFNPAIQSMAQAERWLRIFAADVIGRMDDLQAEDDDAGGGSRRRPRTIAVHHQHNGRFGPTRSKQTQIPMTSNNIDAEVLLKLSRELLHDITSEGGSPAWPILTLSISVSDFVEAGSKANHAITSFLMPSPQKRATISKEDVQVLPERSGAKLEQPESSAGGTESRSKRRRPFFEFENGDEGLLRFNKQMRPDLTQATNAKLVSHGSFATSSSENPTLASNSHNEESPISQLQCKPDEPELLETTADTEHEEGMYECPYCTELIPAAQVLEHLDWHTALDLQKAGSQEQS